MPQMKKNFILTVMIFYVAGLMINFLFFITFFVMINTIKLFYFLCLRVKQLNYRGHCLY